MEIPRVLDSIISSLILSIIFNIVYYLFITRKISFKSPSREGSKYLILVVGLIILFIVVIIHMFSLG